MYDVDSNHAALCYCDTILPSGVQKNAIMLSEYNICRRKISLIFLHSSFFSAAAADATDCCHAFSIKCLLLDKIIVHDVLMSILVSK